MKYQSLRQLFKITQYKDGCIFRTRPLHEVWVDFNPEPDPPVDHIFVSINTERSLKLGWKGTMRRVDDDTPSIVRAGDVRAVE